MPAPHPVPLRSTAHHRLAEQGRIKLGAKVASTNRSGKGDGTRPKAIPWFRFTALERERSAIEQLARCSCGHRHEDHRGDPKTRTRVECSACECPRSDGGPVLPWESGWGKPGLQVTTTKTQIRVVLPPEPFGDGPWYEHWDGGVCQRRCDGEIVRVAASGGEGPEMVERPCMCTDRMVCKPKVRLHVVLPDLNPMVGFWRLETSSDAALKEMPAAAGLIQGAASDLSYGWLLIQERSMRRWDERGRKWHTAHFTVPVLAPAASFDVMLAGGTQARALGPGGLPPRAALGPAVAPMPAHEVDDAFDELPIDDDDDITDAEIVEDGLSGVDERPAPPAQPRRQSDDDVAQEAEYRARAQRRIHARAVTRDRNTYEAVVHQISDGRTTTSKELTLTELARLDTFTEQWAKGELEVELDDGGELRVEAR
jgi:hypothetical protein